MSSESLQEAYRLIREGSKHEAIRLLTPLVRADPLNADAWWLLANALDNPEQKRRALKRVLSLRPDDERARQMYDSLYGPSHTTTIPGIHDEEEEFSEHDLFAQELERPPRRGRALTFLLAVVGIVTVLSCGLCLVALVIGGSTLRGQIGAIILTVTYEVPGFGNLSVRPSAATPTPGPTAVPTVPPDLKRRGAIQVGQTEQGMVATFQDDAWTLSVDAGEHVTIELDSNDPKFDPHLYLYGPNRQLIAENDDVNGATNRNSRIDITLPTAGVYTIRVAKFSDGGAYTLMVQSGS